MFTFSPNTRARSSEVNQNFTDLSQGIGDVDNNRLQLFRSEVCFDFVQSGLIWSVVSGLNCTMSAGVAYISDGSNYMQRIIAAQIASRTFTASKDTYIDLGTDGVIYYTEVANGATVGMTLSANRIRIAKVISGASTITEIQQTDQRQANTTTTDLGYAGLDPLGNPIRNTSPYEMVFRVTRHNGTMTRSALANGAWTQMPNMIFNYKTGRTKERLLVTYGVMMNNSTAGGAVLYGVFANSGLLLPQSYDDSPSSSLWATRHREVYPVWFAANTTLSMQLMYQHAGTITYTNNNTDQSYTMPTVQLRVTKAGA